MDKRAATFDRKLPAARADRREPSPAMRGKTGQRARPAKPRSRQASERAVIKRSLQQALDKIEAAGLDADALSHSQRVFLARLHTQLSDFTAGIAGSNGPAGDIKGKERKTHDVEPTPEQLRRAWVDDGLLISAADMSNAWSRTRQAIDQARMRGEVFGVRVKNAYHYPASFAQLSAEDVKKVNRHLVGDDAAAKFIFWARLHGGAGGKTITALIADGQVARAVELAQGWSAEHGASAGA
jgi:hypothetical protein